MRVTLVLAFLGLAACTSSNPGATTQAITCESGQTTVYTNRFAPTPGASGVATGEDAANGKTNSDGPVSGGISGGAPTPTAGGDLVGPDAPTGNTPAPTPKPLDGPITAMVASCQPTMCADGQVAVEIPPMVGNNGDGPVLSGGPASGPSAGPSDPAIDDSGTAEVDAPAIPTPPNVQLSPPGTLLCVPPPPACDNGMSPQYNSKGQWECTDCAIVVTYGGAYGNYRRCANEPNIKCEDGQVPTWVFETETWECKITCDNGQYDQHTIGGELVCVPC